MTMAWTVLFHDDFAPEFQELAEVVAEKLAEMIVALSKAGPQLGRPRVDTLNGSKHKNMKEIRLKADDGVWRFAFAFDPDRQAVVLCGGDKSGQSEARFYKALIAKADKRFDEWLE